LNDILKQNIDVFIEATGDTIIRTEHGVKLINNKKNLVVNE
jgi:predicted homoserine dehydrogenase-like protein